MHKKYAFGSIIGSIIIGSKFFFFWSITIIVAFWLELLLCFVYCGQNLQIKICKCLNVHVTEFWDQTSETKGEMRQAREPTALRSISNVHVVRTARPSLGFVPKLTTFDLSVIGWINAMRTALLSRKDARLISYLLPDASYSPLCNISLIIILKCT